METKLAVENRISKPFAKNIPEGALPAPPDHYTDLTAEVLKQIPARHIEWFTNHIGQSVFVASQTYQGAVKINDHAEAKQYFLSQFDGCRFLSLIERAKQAFGSMYHDQSLAYPGPEFYKEYTFSYYLNGDLIEAKQVRFIGLTTNLTFYIFHYLDGPDTNGNSCHLLPIGDSNFPTFMKRITPDANVLEKYNLYTPFKLKTNAIK